jgi:threonine dehydratase
MTMVTIEDIRDAARKIAPFIHKTPLIHSDSFSNYTGTDVYLKTENLQKTGSFKVRGAFNRIIDVDEENVIAASMGNHAQAVAYAASRLGKRSKIIMPVSAPIVKVQATKGYGAEVVLHGERFKDALDHALSHEEHIFIHAFDDEKIIAGQGTVGLEIVEDIKNVDAVLVPVGGGGLISGIAIALKAISPETEIIGIQAEAATSAYNSFINKRIMEVPPSSTIADGIAIGRIGERTFEIMSKYVNDLVTVKEDSIAVAINMFLERKKLVVEGAGAVTLAALIENMSRFRGKRVVLVVSGGNVDFTVIDRIIYKGLIKSGRISEFDVLLEDSPGSLQKLTTIIASHKGNILNIRHDRLSQDLPMSTTRVHCTVEIQGREHLHDLMKDLASQGLDVKKRIYD